MSHHGNGYQYPTRSCDSCLILYPKPMCFVSEGVCVMHYCGPMPYAVQFPAHQLGGPMELCVIRGYVLSEVCVKRGSTVCCQLLTINNQ